MRDNRHRGRRPEAYKRWWLVPLAVVLGLLVVAAALVIIARAVYDNSDPHRFPSVLATGVLLNSAVVVTLGAAATTVLSIASEIRARAERAAEKRLELFRRMRQAHVRVVLAQQILRAQGDAGTYDEQMRALLPVVKDLEEIREEVKVSGRLYADRHRRLIMKGIALIITYLQKGVAEYVTWCRQSGGQPPETPPRGVNAWVVKLVADHDSGRPTYDAGDERWEPEDHMPKDYDDGLELSKLVMRAYVYGAPREPTSPGTDAGASRD